LVAKSANDGVLAYFGYPEAAEDDAEQAVRAGLAVIREAPSLNDRLRARVGIATGLVVSARSAIAQAGYLWAMPSRLRTNCSAPLHRTW
jgi:class 3 adenylate cyclase